MFQLFSKIKKYATQHPWLFTLRFIGCIITLGLSEFIIARFHSSPPPETEAEALEFDWSDLLFMYNNSYAIRYHSGWARNLDGLASTGMATGDAYSLGTLAFDPTQPILDKNNSEEQCFRQELRSPTQQALNPITTLFPNYNTNPSDWENMRAAGYNALSNPNNTRYNAIKKGLAKQMTRHLFSIIKYCYENFPYTDQIFLLLKNFKGSNASYELSPQYPTGKCGKQSFTNDQVASTFCLRPEKLIKYTGNTSVNLPTNIIESITRDQQQAIIKKIKNLADWGRGRPT